MACPHGAAIGLNREHARAFDLEAGDLRSLMNLDTELGGPRRVAPRDRIVTHHAAVRVPERRNDRIRAVVTNIQQRTNVLYSLTVLDDLDPGPQQLAHFRAPVKIQNRRGRMRDRYLAALGKLDVEAKLVGKPAVGLDALFEKRDRLVGNIGRAHTLFVISRLQSIRKAA